MLKIFKCQNSLMFILTSEKIILCVKRIYINIRKIAIFFLKINIWKIVVKLILNKIFDLSLIIFIYHILYLKSCWNENIKITIYNLIYQFIDV